MSENEKSRIRNMKNSKTVEENKEKLTQRCKELFPVELANVGVKMPEPKIESIMRDSPLSRISEEDEEDNNNIIVRSVDGNLYSPAVDMYNTNMTFKNNKEEGSTVIVDNKKPKNRTLKKVKTYVPSIYKSTRSKTKKRQNAVNELRSRLPNANIYKRTRSSKRNAPAFRTRSALRI